MKLANTHPSLGYYLSSIDQNNAIIGREGDFITAPEISQVFGEVCLKANFYLKDFISFSI
jgi:SAM-dependent MidA family methyltransferase